MDVKPVAGEFAGRKQLSICLLPFRGSDALLVRLSRIAVIWDKVDQRGFPVSHTPTFDGKFCVGIRFWDHRSWRYTSQVRQDGLHGHLLSLSLPEQFRKLSDTTLPLLCFRVLILGKLFALGMIFARRYMIASGTSASSASIARVEILFYMVHI